MKYDITDALQAFKTRSTMDSRGYDYTGLEWLDSEQKPQKQKVADKIAELDAAEPMRLLRIERIKKLH